MGSMTGESNQLKGQRNGGVGDMAELYLSVFVFPFVTAV